MRFPARFPWRFGTHDNTQDVIHQTLLDALAPGWDVSVGTEAWIDARVDALAVTLIWQVNRRVANQGKPLRMLDVLPDWEQAASLVVLKSDTDVARRRRLAAKLRAIVNNAIQDIEDVCRTHLGTNFVELMVVDPTDAITYWPGVNPGPPGYEFSSTRACICAHANLNNIADSEWLRRRDSLVEDLENSMPAWMRGYVGVGTGAGTSFVCNIGIVGQTII